MHEPEGSAEPALTGHTNRGTLSVAAVVPLYRPDSSALANLAKLAACCPVVAVDDGSPREFAPLLLEIDKLRNVRLLRLGANRGIAFALNRGVQLCFEEGADCVLTFDQDSTPSTHHIDSLVSLIAEDVDRKLGLIGPGWVGGQPMWGADFSQSAELHSVPAIYQSGMCIPKRTWKAVGAFDEGLFIDGVDNDYCLRVRGRGLIVGAVGSLEMEHQLGAGASAFRRVRFGPFSPVATFHPSGRRYYINRNTVRLLSRYGWRERAWAMMTLRRLIAGDVLACTIEDDRLYKFLASLVGVWHGLLGRGGKAPEFVEKVRALSVGEISEQQDPLG